MADHKAPTQVTIAPYEEASQLKQAVDRYWKPFLAVAVLFTTAILWSQVSKHQDQAVHDESWGRLGSEITLAQLGQGAELPSAPAIAQLAEKLEGTPAAPWASALEVERLIEDGNWAAAEDTLSKLERAYPDHALVAWPLPLGLDRATMTLPERLRQYMASEKAFAAAHASLFGLPPLPEGSPRVELDTTAGKIILGLYAERAPKHTENFIKLVSSGYYNGTKFHRVIPGFMVQGGDPNSKIGDPTSWGSGGPDYKVPAESTGLFHFKGVLAGAKLEADVDSSGSQFYITTGEAHHLDGKHTVFGIMLEGDDAVRIIENAPVETNTERPMSPTTIISATVLD